MTNPAVWRVMVVDDYIPYRETVCYVLQADPQFQVVAEVDSGQRAIQLVRQVSPNLILLAFRLPDSNGLVVAKKLKAWQPKVIILILSVDWSPAYERRAKAAGIQARLAKQTFSLAEMYRVLGERAPG